MTDVTNEERLRRRLKRIAAWAENYDGDIAATIIDALDLHTPHWSDEDERKR